MNLAALGLSALAAVGAVQLTPTAPPAVGVSVDKQEVVPIPVEVVYKSWKCPDCNDNEKYVLKTLQEKTKNLRSQSTCCDHGKHQTGK